MRGRQFWALFALGVVGVVSIIPTINAMIARRPIPAGAPPRNVLVALSLVQPTLLMAAGVAIGLRFAPSLGLHSYVAEAAAGGARVWPALRRDIPLAVGLGAVAMGVVVLLDVAFRPFMGDAWRRLEQDPPTSAPVSLLGGLFYGGITEELMVRWGLMSLVARLVWQIGGGASDAPPHASVMWVAAVTTAILFGVAHLPAASMLVPLNAVIIVRTVLLNAVAGVAFGWLFWRHSLEAAMVAHAASHVVLFAVRVATR